jgi:hypothetical protein
VRRMHVMMGLLTLAAAVIIASGGYSQDKKDDPKKDPPVAVKATTLPKGWAKLGIAGDQKKKIYAVLSTYQTKIAALKAEVEQLQKEEYQEAYKLLTDDQKDLLKKLSDPSKGADDKKKVPDKDKDKDK